MIRKAAVACILAVIQSAALIPSIHAENWPQILGLNRDGVVAELRVVQGWPTGEPTIHWRYPVGDGYAGPAVIDNQILVFHRIGAKERIESIARDTGKSLWRRDFDAYYRSSLDPDSGPRCVPLVVDDRVVVFGAAGACHAVKLHGGEQLWSRDLAEQYDSPDGYFGAGSTPVHVNGIVVINLGGEKNNAGMVGLDIATGQTVWANTSELASYSSPIVVKHEGKDRVFAVTRFNGILLDPTTGALLLTTPFG
ncbi:MAG: PQQ-binding-like beta-propeller repeat protein, partial [Planctomycetales bacterium]|nr:PQQ-binding-like beta-propeller repeat protein [Planctomycetales bacterium]